MTRNIILIAWFLSSASMAGSGIQSGLDRLIAQDFKMLDGQNVAILTHQSAVDGRGRHLLKTLPAKRSFRIKTLLAPEHGFYGRLDSENIANALEPQTDLTIYSLYGKTKKPTAAMLAGVDRLIIDLQDIGTRFYTYQTTVFYALQACSELGVAVLLLDRPNPIGGLKVAGPLLEQQHFSFTGAFSMPVVHGMTMGELARMFVAERQLSVRLEVLAVVGWQRSQGFEETGLLWVNPSPNMRRPKQALLYPAIGLLEYTNLSVGRGTDTPFERLGAPWLNPVDFVKQLKRAKLPGLRYTPHFFTPTSGPYAGQVCGGVYFDLKDVASFEPVRTGITISQILIRDYNQKYQPEKMLKLLGHSAVFQALIDGANWEKLRGVYQPDLDRFLKRRQKYLLY